jgi:hypothetical protein
MPSYHATVRSGMSLSVSRTNAAGIDQAGATPIRDDASKAFVFRLLVLDERPSHELVVELAEGEHETLCRVFVDNC